MIIARSNVCKASLDDKKKSTVKRVSQINKFWLY